MKTFATSIPLLRLLLSGEHIRTDVSPQTQANSYKNNEQKILKKSKNNNLPT
jgi:hypothetical protein